MYPSFMQTRSVTLTPVSESKLVAAADRMLAARPDARWSRVLDETWCHLRPAGDTGPDQGWKLHLSASTDTATDVLERALEVLLDAGCPLKFAASLDRLALLNSAHYPRGGAGKFITAYPGDDELFRTLAARLDEATAGLTGPAILSDRPYRPGSVVHYRYGGFVRRQRLSNDAERILVIAAPDGSLVEDERNAWFSAPPWASDPFPDRPAPAAAKAATKADRVVLDDRFLARGAIRQSNRGGVYRATDLRSGSEVIVKQARRGVVGNTGEDAQAGLRREMRNLTALAPLGFTPAGLSLFEQGGDLFLAQDLIDGESLRMWIRRHARVIGPQTPDRPGVAWTDLVPVLRQLVEVLAAVHDAGWALCDLSPANVMVSGSGDVRLVDLESAVPIGERAPIAGTPGFAPPESLSDVDVTPAADLYALGAIAFMMASGNDPLLAPDAPSKAWPAGMIRWLELTASQSPDASAAPALPLVRGLTEARPGDRWSLAKVRAYLQEEPRPGGEGRPAARPSTWERLIDDGFAHLAATAEDPASDWYWAGTCTAGSVDRCNVQHGSAGVLAVLARALRHEVPAVSPELLAAAADWTEKQLSAEPLILPGLYFGRSGTAWALHDVATATSDAALAASAVLLARQVPIDWPNPDVAHGLAGAGLAQLQFWQVTGLADFRTRAVRCAERLAARAARSDGELTWPVPADFTSRLAGIVHYGFAHGVAGIGYFLVALGEATDRADFIDLADEAGQTLCAAAVRDDDGALWPTSAGGRAVPDPSEHWCSGASGVGTFLVRLWQATGTERYLDLARAAAHAVWRRRWYASAVSCHGLTGNGQFLLDLAEATGERRFHEWAEGLATLIDGQHLVHAGRRLVPDETRAGFGAEYGVGMSGVLDFLLRLRHGGPRLWLPASGAESGETALFRSVRAGTPQREADRGRPAIAPFA